MEVVIRLKALLEIKNLFVQFSGSDHKEYAVEDVSFEVRRGEVLGIVGESGSGKSVTCYSLLGLLPVNGSHTVNGQARFDQSDLFGLSDRNLREIRGKRIGMVFQDPMSALNPYMSIGDQIIEPLLHHTETNKADAKVRAIHLLEEVGIDDAAQRFDDYPHMFSGGMRQRVVIAMALIMEPDLLIADEPTSALDVTTQVHIIKLIKEAQSIRDLSVIFISHDLGVVRNIADRVMVMEKGQVVEQGESWKIFDRPEHPYTKKLLAAIPKTAKPQAFRLQHASSRQLLDVKNLEVRYDDQLAVDDVSFTLQRGEVLGIVGESGSGKSTLSKAIVRLTHVDRGEVLFDGVPLLSSRGEVLRGLRKKVQMVFQDPYSSLNPRMTAFEIIAEPIQLHEINTDAKSIANKVARLMRDVGLPETALHRYPHEFSGGQCQRIAIARAIAAGPDLLIADEPVSALDVTVQAEILKLLLVLVKAMNLTMIFISHDMAVVRYVSDRVAVIEAGRLVELGETEQIFSYPSHRRTQALVDTVNSELE